MMKIILNSPACRRENISLCPIHHGFRVDPAALQPQTCIHELGLWSRNTGVHEHRCDGPDGLNGLSQAGSGIQRFSVAHWLAPTRMAVDRTATPADTNSVDCTRSLRCTSCPRPNDVSNSQDVDCQTSVRFSLTCHFPVPLSTRMGSRVEWCRWLMISWICSGGVDIVEERVVRVAFPHADRIAWLGDS